MKVIALSGFKQSGKDTSADYLVDTYNFEKFSFAETLKDMVAQQYDIPREWCDDNKYKEEPILKYPVDPKDDFSKAICKLLKNEFSYFETYKNAFGPDLNIPKYWTPRSLCILEGSVKRSVNSGYWIKRIIDKIKQPWNEALAWSERDQLPPVEMNFVISDLRYRSEAEQLKQEFGDDLIIIRLDRFDNINSNDPSERDLDNYKFDYIIRNRGTKQELYSELDKIYGNISS